MTEKRQVVWECPGYAHPKSFGAEQSSRYLSASLLWLSLVFIARVLSCILVGSEQMHGSGLQIFWAAVTTPRIENPPYSRHFIADGQQNATECTFVVVFLLT